MQGQQQAQPPQVQAVPVAQAQPVAVAQPQTAQITQTGYAQPQPVKVTLDLSKILSPNILIIMCLIVTIVSLLLLVLGAYYITKKMPYEKESDDAKDARTTGLFLLILGFCGMSALSLIVAYGSRASHLRMGALVAVGLIMIAISLLISNMISESLMY